MAMLCRPEMMKLTVPPALIVATFGVITWALVGGVPWKLGNRSRGGEDIQAPKLTVALLFGSAAKAPALASPRGSKAAALKSEAQLRRMAGFSDGGRRTASEITPLGRDRRTPQGVSHPSG